MTAFDAEIDASFEDPNIGVDATWRTGGAGNGLPVRVIVTHPQEEAGYRDSRFDLPATLIDIRRSEVPAPSKADTVEVDGGATFEITGLGRLDSGRYVQTCEAAELED